MEAPRESDGEGSAQGGDRTGDVPPGRPAASGLGFCRQRLDPRRPHAHVRLDIRYMGKPKGDDLCAQLGVGAVSGIL